MQRYQCKGIKYDHQSTNKSINWTINQLILATIPHLPQACRRWFNARKPRLHILRIYCWYWETRLTISTAHSSLWLCAGELVLRYRVQWVLDFFCVVSRSFEMGRGTISMWKNNRSMFCLSWSVPNLVDSCTNFGSLLSMVCYGHISKSWPFFFDYGGGSYGGK